MGTIEESGGTVHWLQRPGTTRLRVAHWPGGGRGVVLLLHGRSEFIEKYLETVAALRQRGFAVWTADWRGQGLSSRALPDPLAGHVRDFGEYVGDLGAVLDRFVLPGLGEQRVVMVGVSMGGLVGAHLLAERGERIAAAVLVAPMIDFLRGRWGPRPLVSTLVRLFCTLPGHENRYAPGVPRRPLVERPFENNRLTSCPERFAADRALLAANAELALGGVTWGWLRAALQSVARIEQRRVLERIRHPVLVVSATEDRVVDNRAMRRFAMRISRGKLVRMLGARHDILRERDEVRHAFWQAVDEFLAPVI